MCVPSRCARKRSTTRVTLRPTCVSTREKDRTTVLFQTARVRLRHRATWMTTLGVTILRLGRLNQSKNKEKRLQSRREGVLNTDALLKLRQKMSPEWITLLRLTLTNRHLRLSPSPASCHRLFKKKESLLSWPTCRPKTPRQKLLTGHNHPPS